jgi:hypothetical protein
LSKSLNFLSLLSERGANHIVAIPAVKPLNKEFFKSRLTTDIRSKRISGSLLSIRSSAKIESFLSSRLSTTADSKAGVIPNRSEKIIADQDGKVKRYE